MPAFERRICSVYISDWVQVESQKSSPVLIQHPLEQMPAKVEVQVKIQENGYDVIFPAFGSAQRDDDSDNIYGGVVYIYNENHVKIFVPVRNNESNKGVLIFTGDSYKTIEHGLGEKPDFVVVQLKMTNGYVSEAAGVTFNSEVFKTYEKICGTVFAFNDQEIRLWSMSNNVACAVDGWGTEGFRCNTASLYIQAWILYSCDKLFSKQFTLDKSDTNTVERVSLDSVYSLDSAFVSVLLKVLSPNNEGFMFHAGGSAMIDTSNDSYGAIIYGYNETEVMLWRPSPTNTNGHLVYVGGQWGDGQSNQESDVVEVVVKVIDITGTPCNGTESCSPDLSKTRCISTDCPIPPDIDNAYKLYEGVTNGSKTLYSCKPGYTESSDDVIINCVEGTWSFTSMFCRDTAKRIRSNITNETLAEWIKEMKKNLSVHKSKTSAYNRSLISVYESRPSAVQIGSVGVFLMSFTIIVLIFPDIVAVVKNLHNKINKNFGHRRMKRNKILSLLRIYNATTCRYRVANGVLYSALRAIEQQGVVFMPTSTGV
ncbi:uncharacterized protein LOC134275615 [Saccostrea cucullata]|uniref:uncharacterized protein LOC134275615 n=1 Tax=Saccostrea cuccullata TaxID=36930 RepID=UPI002ED16E41